MEKLTVQWDVIVIGAGPAGSIAALEIAKSGPSVLLVDKASFPRTKVCGSCLNRRSLLLLNQIGINDLENRLGAQIIQKFHFATPQKHVSVAFSGCSLSRERFDYQLIQEAVKRGVHFLPNTRAVMGEVENEARNVTLLNGKTNQIIQSKIVLIADGLSGSALAGQHVITEMKPRSRIGIGTIVNEGPAFYESGTIYMAYSKEGYVGTVRLEDGRLDVAAALYPGLIQQGIEASLRKIWNETGFPEIMFPEKTHWLGTPSLTRSKNQLGGERFFIIGDAAAYTEPFTGEGISWAIASAVAVAPVAIRALSRWSYECLEEWNLKYRREIGRRQIFSKFVTASLKHPRFIQSIIPIVDKVSCLTNSIVKWMEQ